MAWWLNLGANRFSNAAAAGSVPLAPLEALNLGYNNVSDAGVQALRALPRANRLEASHLLGAPICADQRQQLRKAFRGILG